MPLQQDIDPRRLYPDWRLSCLDCEGREGREAALKRRVVELEALVVALRASPLAVDVLDDPKTQDEAVAIALLVADAYRNAPLGEKRAAAVAEWRRANGIED